LITLQAVNLIIVPEFYATIKHSEFTTIKQKRMKRRIKVTILFLLAVSLFTNAQTADTSAQKSDSIVTVKKTAPWFVERFKLTGGFFVPVSNTNIQVGIKGGVAGTDIDFEKDLGFNKDQLTFLSNFQWRITRRSRINLNYYNIPRSSTHTLDKDISFNGQTFPVNATVNSYFNTAIYQFSYGFAILEKPKYEFGLIIGTHLVGGKAGISLNSDKINASTNSNFGFTAPLPDLGIWGGYAFNKHLAMNLDASYLSLTVGDISGSILAYNLLFIYRVIDKLDVSLGYSGLNCRVDAVKTNVEGHFKWGYNGPSLGVSYSFGKKSWGI
jgi:hypothetical protein